MYKVHVSLTHFSNRSPNNFDWSQFSGRKISLNSKTFVYPFLSNGMVHANVKFDKIFDVSRGFGSSVFCEDCILAIHLSNQYCFKSILF